MLPGSLRFKPFLKEPKCYEKNHCFHTIITGAQELVNHPQTYRKIGKTTVNNRKTIVSHPQLSHKWVGFQPSTHGFSQQTRTSEPATSDSQRVLEDPIQLVQGKTWELPTTWPLGQQCGNNGKNILEFGVLWGTLTYKPMKPALK